MLFVQYKLFALSFNSSCSNQVGELLSGFMRTVWQYFGVQSLMEVDDSYKKSAGLNSFHHPVFSVCKFLI